jgi:hypothetical protein
MTPLATKYALIVAKCMMPINWLCCNDIKELIPVLPSCEWHTLYVFFYLCQHSVNVCYINSIFLNGRIISEVAIYKSFSKSLKCNDGQIRISWFSIFSMAENWTWKKACLFSWNNPFCCFRRLRRCCEWFRSYGISRSELI